jgi:predicted ATPase
MVGKPSPQNPLISQLTLPPETITSCSRRIRQLEFQPHSGRHRAANPGIQMILATHSPEIIFDLEDKMIPLEF